MKLVIAEYLRTLRERDELDRLLPDLLVEMGYVPVARPQTGNRQFGVDLAARGQNSKTGIEELLLLVVKQGDIGRTEWNDGNQGVRSSINEILDVYLRSHIEPQDSARRIRIVVATNGELKQVARASWSGFATEHSAKADFEFWGLDRIAELVEQYLLDEHVFRDEDRKQLRRALALSGDSEYDQRDLHRLFLRTLGLSQDGALQSTGMSKKELVKALRIVNLSAQAFASWSVNDGDARQGVRAMERALLWSWHRIQLAEESHRDAAIVDGFSSLWLGYLTMARRYFEKVQEHCHVEDGLFGYYSDGSEFSMVAFEQIGLLASIGLSQIAFATNDEELDKTHRANARVVAEALASAVQNNGICSSPCMDRHSQDITLGLMLLLVAGMVDEAKEWLKKLVRNVDYAYKAKRYVPISSDSLDELAESGGWSGEQTDPRVMNMSWTIPTLAGWCAILKMDESYQVLASESQASYPGVCLQLWHPDDDIYRHLYFCAAHHECGASEAPIQLPDDAASWRMHLATFTDSDQARMLANSSATKAGVQALDLIASRHFSTPVAPAFWYQLLSAPNGKPEESAMAHGDSS
jgi:hypothetical protein